MDEVMEKIGAELGKVAEVKKVVIILPELGEDGVLPADHGMFEILNPSGDTKLMWDRRKSVEVEAAEEMFDSLIKKRYLAFEAVGEDGRKGKQIDKFDPNMERIILVPPMVGG